MLIHIQVSNEAEHCLTVVLSQYDPFRCLSVCFVFHSLALIWLGINLIVVIVTVQLILQVIVPLLVTEDEKTLVTCINCLTKVISAEYGSLTELQIYIRLGNMQA